MSCFHKSNQICTLNNIPIEGKCMCSDYHQKKEVKYCKYCFNSHIYRPTEEELMNPFTTELTDENDFSSISVGECCEHLRFIISSGYGEPVRIEIDEYLPKLKEWHTFGKYYPKYCPECGRRLNEYEVSKENN